MQISQSSSLMLQWTRASLRRIKLSITGSPTARKSNCIQKVYLRKENAVRSGGASGTERTQELTEGLAVAGADDRVFRFLLAHTCRGCHALSLFRPAPFRIAGPKLLTGELVVVNPGRAGADEIVVAALLFLPRLLLFLLGLAPLVAGFSR